MSNFLDVLKHIIAPDDGSFEMDNLLRARNLIDSLGENARRLLEIGRVQDELVKLGFTLDVATHNAYKIDSMDNGGSRLVVFRSEFAYFGGAEFYFASPTWQNDLINAVRNYYEI